MAAHVGSVRGLVAAMGAAIVVGGGNSLMTNSWITIVSGLPRSGTSMMMRMIEAAGIPVLTDRVRAADEDNPNGYYELEAVKHTRTDPSWVARARGKAVKMVHLLLPDLPPGQDYRIILMQRDIDEIITSQRKMLDRKGRTSAHPAMLKRVYASQLDATKRWMDSNTPGRWLEMSYNRVMSDPAGQAAAIGAFLGVGAETWSAMAATVNPQLYRNRANIR
jgi:Sulfotransferase family